MSDDCRNLEKHLAVLAEGQANREADYLERLARYQASFAKLAEKTAMLSGRQAAAR